MIRDILKYSITNIKQRKLRSFLTTLSILIGITAIFSLISFGQGINAYMNEFAQEQGTDKIFLMPGGGLATAPGTSNILYTEEDIDFIRKIKQDKEKTIILSTHDPLEAIKLADRIAVLKDGAIIQVGKPNEVFTSPKDEFTALFVGYQNIS